MAYADRTNENIRSLGANVAETASDLADKAGQRIGDAVESAEHTFHAISAQGAVAGEQVQVVAGNLKTAIDKSVQDQPMTTLLLAAGVGFLLGALWKS